MDIKLNYQITYMMIDTSTAYNLIIDRKVRQLGLNLEKNFSQTKAMNLKAKQISELTKGVPINIKT